MFDALRHHSGPTSRPALALITALALWLGACGSSNGDQLDESSGSGNQTSGPGQCSLGDTQPCSCTGGGTGTMSCTETSVGTVWSACANCVAAACSAGEYQTCPCPDGSSGGQTCIEGMWGDCRCGTACSPGMTQSCLCPSGLGTGTQSCEATGQWGACAGCDQTGGECTTGDSQPCACPNGTTGSQLCNAGAWTDCVGCASGGGPCPAPYACGENAFVMGMRFCGQDMPPFGHTPPQCVTDADCAALEVSCTPSPFGVSGCIRPCD